MKGHIKNFIYLFAILMVIWMALTLSLDQQELLLGITLIFILSIALYRSYHKIGLPGVTIKKIVFFCIYIIIDSGHILTLS